MAMEHLRARAITLLALTFVAGVAGGVAGERLWLRPYGAGPGSVHGHGHAVIERFADDLGLSKEQRVRIEPILEHFRGRLGEMSHEMRPRFEALMDSARTQIEAVLTPEQAARYRELLERRRERGRRHPRGKAGGDHRGAESPGGAETESPDCPGRGR